jgi:DNA repair protein RadA/Sms
VEETINKTPLRRGSGGARPIKLSEIENKDVQRISTGISELDLVLGGGLVPGMAVLLAGEPGVGKSTLLLQMANNIWHVARGNNEPRAVLYVAGEESASQIKIRAQRLGIKGENLEILETTDVDEINSHLAALHSRLIIVDSIQTLTTSDLSGTAGSVGQVRECAGRLISQAKSIGIPLILVGHVTKDGTIAGPKVLEHAVDTVLSLEGERFSGLRLLRTTKNRFGPTDEVGVLEMGDAGLRTKDINGLIADSTDNRVGSCLTVTMEGTRPMILEIQALTTPTPLPSPRRVGNGVDYNRLQMIIAILQKRLNLPLYKEDVYVTISGGIKVGEPAIDLAVALAILSSYRNKALGGKMIAVGELDLLGNVREVNSLAKRIKEGQKLGFKNILSSKNLTSIASFKLQ